MLVIESVVETALCSSPVQVEVICGRDCSTLFAHINGRWFIRRTTHTTASTRIKCSGMWEETLCHAPGQWIWFRGRTAAS
jgi:hypothetical protein